MGFNPNRLCPSILRRRWSLVLLNFVQNSLPFCRGAKLASDSQKHLKAPPRPRDTAQKTRRGENSWRANEVIVWVARGFRPQGCGSLGALSTGFQHAEVSDYDHPPHHCAPHGNITKALPTALVSFQQHVLSVCPEPGLGPDLHQDVGPSPPHGEGRLKPSPASVHQTGRAQRAGGSHSFSKTR